MLKHWKRKTFLEFGEHILPHDYTLDDKASGYCWRSLCCESFTGMITRYLNQTGFN